MAGLLLNSGIAAETALLVASAFDRVGWGTGGTAPAAGNTGLETASAEARATGTQSAVTTTVTDDTYQVVATLTSASAQTIREVVLFDAATAGTALLRATHADTALEIGEGIEYTIKSTLSGA